MLAAAARRPRRLSTSMAPAFWRHTLIFLLAAVGTFALVTVALPHEAPSFWVIGGLAAGLVASLLARGIVGFTILAVGHLVGIGVEYEWGPVAWPADELLATAPMHVATVAAAAVSYTLGRVARLS